MGGGVTNFPGGSSASETLSYLTDPATVYSDFVALPTNRRLADNGDRPLLVWRIRAFLAGRGASRTFRLGLDLGTGNVGITYTAPFIKSAASSAADTGWIAIDRLSQNGGNYRCFLEANGGFYLGRSANGTGSTSILGGSSGVWSGSLSGRVEWAEVPTAPTSVSGADIGGGQIRVSWGAPTDDGGKAVNGYRVELDDNTGFSSPQAAVVASNVSSYDFSITPGVTYYARVFARNAVTDAASTQSVASATATVATGDVPGAPLSVAATAGRGFLEVAWAPPADDGGIAITAYNVDVSPASDFSSGVVTQSVDDLVRTHTFAGLTPGTTYYARVSATNAIGTGTESSSDSDTLPARDALDCVFGASASVPASGAWGSGATFSLTSDGADTPQIKRTCRAFGSTTDTSPGAVLTGFYTPGGLQNLAVVTDAAGNAYVVGVDAAATSSIRVAYFERTGAAAWSFDNVQSQGLAATDEPIVALDAVFIAGSGASPVSSILVIARRAGVRTTGAVSFALVSVATAQAGSGTLFLSSGSNPSWLSSPPAAAAPNTGVVAAAPMGSSRVAVFADGRGVVDVVNGAISSISKDTAGTTYSGVRRVVGIDATRYALIGPSGSDLAWQIVDSTNATLASGTISGTLLQGGSASDDNFDAFYDAAARQVRVIGLDATSTRALRRWGISVDSYGVTATLTGDVIGSAATTNSAVRVPRGVVDERAVIVDAANLDGSTKSVAAYADTYGNVAPSAPSLTTLEGFDATTARSFAWLFGDTNDADTQTAFELSIELVGGGEVYNSGKTTSAGTVLVLTGGTLTNGNDYRWRVRTYDELDAVGAWSDYDEFTASALGSLTITTPATDNVAGIDTSSLLIVWSYVQGDGYTQTQRRVRVIRTSDESVLSDTTMQASTTGSYTVADLPTDEEVRVEVSIVTNAPGTPTIGPAERLVTASYGAPMTPTVSIDEIASTYIAVAVTNPTPSGDRPEIVRNIIERRVSSPSADFVAIGECSRGGIFYDYTVGSGVAYDYRAKGSTE